MIGILPTFLSSIRCLIWLTRSPGLPIRGSLCMNSAAKPLKLLVFRSSAGVTQPITFSSLQTMITPWFLSMRVTTSFTFTSGKTLTKLSEIAVATCSEDAGILPFFLVPSSLVRFLIVRIPTTLSSFFTRIRRISFFSIMSSAWESVSDLLIVGGSVIMSFTSIFFTFGLISFCSFTALFLSSPSSG